MKSLIPTTGSICLSCERHEIMICVFGKYDTGDIITFVDHYYPNTFSWQIKNQEPCWSDQKRRTHYTLCQPKYLVT